MLNPSKDAKFHVSILIVWHTVNTWYGKVEMNLKINATPKKNNTKADIDSMSFLEISSYTCIPHNLVPIILEVEFWHFFINLCFFSSDTSSPCCLVPIFISRTHGLRNLAATFSKSINSNLKLRQIHKISKPN